MPWAIHVNFIYHCGVLTVTIVVIIFRVRVVTATSNPSDSWCKSGQCGTTQVTSIGCEPETRTRNYGLWAHYVTITPTRDLFELPPRVELGTTDYKSVILPAKLQKHLSYIVQAFYFQFRELVSNLTLLTTVRVPEDITFVLGRGVEPLLPGWKPEVLTDRRTEQLFFYYQHVKELFCSVVIFNNNTKLIHLFDIDKHNQKKNPSFWDGFL